MCEDHPASLTVEARMWLHADPSCDGAVDVGKVHASSLLDGSQLNDSVPLVLNGGIDELNWHAEEPVPVHGSSKAPPQFTLSFQLDVPDATNVSTGVADHGMEGVMKTVDLTNEYSTHPE